MWYEADIDTKIMLYSLRKRAYLLSYTFRFKYLILIILVSSLLVLIISLSNLILNN